MSMSQIQTMRAYGFVAIGIWIFMWILYRQQLTMELRAANNFVTLRSEYVDLFVDKRSLKFVVKKHDHRVVLEGEFADVRLGGNLPLIRSCRQRQTDRFGRTCLNWSRFYRLFITKRHDQQKDRDVICYDFEQKFDAVKNQPVFEHLLPISCFTMNKVGYRGNGISSFPVNYDLFMSPGDDRDTEKIREENYYLLTSNSAIFLPAEASVLVDVDSFRQKICFKPRIDNRKRIDLIDSSRTDTKPAREAIHLNLTVCHSNRNIDHIQRYMLSRYRMKADRLPSLDLMSAPVWTTGSQLVQGFRGRNLKAFLKSLNDHDLAGAKCQLIVDQIDYARNIGDFEFDPVKYPPKDGGRELFKTCSVSVAISPFVSTESASYKIAKSGGFLIRSTVSDDPVLIRRDDKWLAVVDFTNPSARRWFRRSLIEMTRKYGIKGFKATATHGVGEANPPPNSRMHERLSNHRLYWTKFVETVSDVDASSVTSTDVVYRNQKQPIYVHAPEPSSNWDYSGIKSVTASVLKHGLLGYAFIISGPIGGTRRSEQLPRRDLYIRWMQLSAYLPVMQFSVPPWKYDDKVVELARKYIKLHEKRVYPELVKAARQSVIDGSPLVRPVWWNSKSTIIPYHIKHENLVGNDLLVVPVLDEQSTVRYLYIPDGLWKHDINGRKYRGPKTYMYRYRVAIDEILTFSRIK